MFNYSMVSVLSVMGCRQNCEAGCGPSFCVVGRAVGQVTEGQIAGHGVPKLAVWAGLGPSYSVVGCRPGGAQYVGQAEL